MLDWEETLRQAGALWVHDGNPEHCHARYTSGLHANEFFNGRVVAENEALKTETVQNLLVSSRHMLASASVHIVFGPATGAKPFVEECAHRLNAMWAMTAKNGHELEITTETNQPIEAGATALPFEDTISTGGSIERSISIMEMHGAIVLPIILALINRTGKKFIGERRVVALLDRPTKLWTPEECPLCKEGSKAVRPKENWDLLTAA